VMAIFMSRIKSPMYLSDRSIDLSFWKKPANSKELISFKVFRHILISAIFLASVITSGCHYKAHQTAPNSFSEKGDIHIKISGLRNDRGQVIASLFANDKGFPTEVDLSLLTIHKDIQEGKAEVLFRDIPYGYYAVCILHDENLDGEMKTTLLGTPLEGFSFSGQPDYFLGRPRFKDSRFILISSERELELSMRYETGRMDRQKASRSKKLAI